MSIEPEYELKFHIYDGNERKLTRFISQYKSIREEKKEEGSVMSRVLSYFFDGMIAISEGDQFFWAINYNDAYNCYQEASRMFTRFQNSRNVNARLDLLAERMINRSTGLIKLTESLKTEKISMKQRFLTEALTAFNEEVQITNQMNEVMSAYAAFARASFTESQLLLMNAKEMQETDSDQAKKNLLQARSSLRQASFIDSRFLFALDDIEGDLDDITKNRLLNKAEIHADSGTELSEKGLYLEAKKQFHNAMLFHKRASALASDTGSRRQLLSSATIYEASMHEAEANQLFRRENNTLEASEKFKEAASYVDKSIALIGHFGSKSLISSFKCQSEFYKAMGFQSKAINEFDNELYQSAKELFEQSLQMFKDAIETAKKGENEVISQLATEAVADINGYLSMCDAMVK
ncbi:MAG: hypothetical protein ACW98K_06370 [Candidatus Kariarchaeaceae archaeon]